MMNLLRMNKTVIQEFKFMETINPKMNELMKLKLSIEYNIYIFFFFVFFYIIIEFI